jgi:hypothetical protein
MSYSEKLKSPKWQKKRLEVLNRDNFTCCKCGDTETELHVHHLKYTGEPHEAPLTDLETLCKDCHHYFTFINDQLLQSIEEPYNTSELVSITKTDNQLIVNYSKFVTLVYIKASGQEIQVIFQNNSDVLKMLYEQSIK